MDVLTVINHINTFGSGPVNGASGEGELFGIELFGHLTLEDGVKSGIFFAMTGMHALHVISGVALLLIVWNNGRKGVFTTERHWGVEAAALYWHYVDVVWVFYYPALYLMGTPF